MLIWTPARAELILRLEPGACNETGDVLGCYDAAGQNTLQAILKRAKTCENDLREVNYSLLELAGEKAWYENQWLWFSVGLAAGVGGSITIITMH